METSDKLDLKKHLERFNSMNSFLTLIFVGTLFMAIGEVFLGEFLSKPAQILITIIRAVGGFFLLFGMFKLIKVKPIGAFKTAILVLYFSIVFFQTVRSFSFNPDFYKEMLSTSDTFYPFILALILLSEDTLFILKKSIRAIIYFNIAFLLLSFVFYGRIVDNSSFDFMELVNKYFAYANGFLLLTFHYYNKKVKFLIVLVFALSLFFAIIQARRNQMFTLSLFLIFSIIVYFIRVKIPVYKKILISFFSLLLFVGGITILFLQFQDSIFKKLIERGVEDTRSFVEQDFWYDMDEASIVLGRGIAGTYKCPSLYGVNVNSKFDRGRIETGYLHHILKIGIIGFILMLIITFIALLNGFNKSKNYLAIGASFYLLVYLLEQYPAGNPILTLRLLIFWICIKLLWSRSFLEIPENELKLFLTNLELPVFKKYN